MGRTIHEVVLEQRMPPWHADPRFGRFRQRSPADARRDATRCWLGSSKAARKGDEKDLPPPMEFVEGWRIGQPDAVYQMAEEFKVPATGVLEYKRFTIDPGFTEDVWVQAAEARPGQSRGRASHPGLHPDARQTAFSSAMAPRRRWSAGRPATCRRCTRRARPSAFPPARSSIFEVHYTPNGTEQTDRSSVGIDFCQGASEASR